jgi:DNA repair protein SbcC/Rad50
MTLHLTRLSLRNVRSYESAELEFGPGVTVLVGDVGSGKTSLFHAIEMALFGFAEVEAPYLVRHRSGQASVSLTLSDGEHSYELARTFRRKTRRGREVFDPEEPTFRVDGELRTYSATEFRQRVIELLGFPDNPNPRSRSDLWRWAVYTPQERMREILREDEADARLETIRKALGLERYRLAADNAESLATALRARSRTHADVARGMQHFESDLAKSETDLSIATNALSDGKAAASEARRITAEAEELLAASEAERRRRDADQRESEQRTEDRVRLENSILATERRLSEARAESDREQSRLDALESLGPRVEAAQTGVTDASRAYEEGRERLAVLEVAAKELIAAEAAVFGVRRSLEDLDRTLETQRREVSRAEQEAAEAAQRGPAREPSPPTVRSLEELASLLESLRTEERVALQAAGLREAEFHELSELIEGKICPRCHQAVHPEEFGAHRQEAERARQSASEVLRTTQALLAATEAERASRERFERAHQNWSASNELRERANAAVERSRLRVANEESARADAVARLQAAESTERSVRERAMPYEAARRTITELERRRDLARVSLADLERQLASAPTLRASVASARGHAESEAARLAEHQTRLAEVRAALARLQLALQGASEASRAHAELLAQRDTARRSERTAADAVTSARERRSFAEQRREEAKAGVEERKLLLERSTRLAGLANFVSGAYRDALLDLERRLLGRAQSTFERSFSRAFSMLVEDPGLLARCGPSFVPFVEIDGEWTPAEALSGGERTALALAFRVALGDVVRASGRLRLDTILLDEPTDGFSPEQVIRMGELLRSLPWGQVLVVTHETSLAGVADRTVRVRKEAGLSLLDGDPEAPGATVGSAASDVRRKRPRRIEASTAAPAT